MHTCPVCLFDQMPYPATDYNICPCCGTEFGNDDVEFTLAELCNAWIENGAQWFYEQPPAGWNAWQQLLNGGHTNLDAIVQISLYDSESEYSKREYNDANQQYTNQQYAIAV